MCISLNVLQCDCEGEVGAALMPSDVFCLAACSGSAVFL